jgi:hypothetical protein
MPYTPFTFAEVRLIFQLSERAGGHAGALHVDITNDDLWNRVRDYRGTGLSARTSFIRFDDQVAAALELLNAPANDAAFEQFRCEVKQGQRPHFTMDHTLAVPVQMRYAIGGGTRTFPCRRVRLVLAKDHARPRAMHVVTCFGEMG